MAILFWIFRFFGWLQKTIYISDRWFNWGSEVIADHLGEMISPLMLRAGRPGTDLLFHSTHKPSFASGTLRPSSLDNCSKVRAREYHRLTTFTLLFPERGLVGALGECVLICSTAWTSTGKMVIGMAFAPSAVGLTKQDGEVPCYL
jgi:hypothetical protein